MASKPTRKSSAKPAIAVAGDVCIDWLSVPVPRTNSGLMNWQLRDGRHMYAHRGGAWLTADFVAQAVGASARVLKPAREERDLESVAPEEIIHSMIMLRRGRRDRDKDEVPYWVATSFEGYAGPSYPKRPSVKRVTRDSTRVKLVLLDDAGNGFRDRRDTWPLALARGRRPLILYKVSRPLSEGGLWSRLKRFHLERTIAMLGADELRGEGASISRGLSWERTAAELILSLAREPRFAGLRSCPFIIITLGIEGAVLVECATGRIKGTHLWYLPNLTEGEQVQTDRGNMSGFGSAFAAAVAAALIRSANKKPWDLDRVGKALREGIHHGLVVMDRLLEQGFGKCEMKDAEGKTFLSPPRYPVVEIFTTESIAPPNICHVPLPTLSRDIPILRSWRILDLKRTAVFADLAADVVRRGVWKVFENVPLGRFGDLAVLDRTEIESYRGIRNLMREYLDNPRLKRPLCLAVFGAPGSGKSWGVTQVAKSLDKEGRTEKLTFNLSQWNGPEYLVNAFHRVRDQVIRGKVPLVFFDEFDSKLGPQKYGWVKYFLAPMQDGEFSDGLFTHDIGRAIFVFAGGTVATYEDFLAAVQGDPETSLLKLPDFASRLRGHVNIIGLDLPTDTHLVRRALVLRGLIVDKYKSLVDASGQIQIDDGVLRAFLEAPEYHHGARSLEAILEMSRLGGRTYFDPSLLPPEAQLNLHVDANHFMALLDYSPSLSPYIERIARDIHRFYVKSELDKKDGLGTPLHKIGDWPSLRDWSDLAETYKWSSREQAASYVPLLRAAGCSFAEGDPDPTFKLEDSELDRLARMEHNRWVAERRMKQPGHSALVPWEKLPQEQKDKDIRTVRMIPHFLGKVGLRVVRL